MARKPKYPGYHTDTLPSSNICHRVRVEGNPKKWITIFAAPGEPGFREQYGKARTGSVVERPKTTTEPTVHSFAWLARQYQEFLKLQCETGSISSGTLKKANLYLNRMTKAVGKRPMLLEKKTLYRRETRSLIAQRRRMTRSPAWLRCTIGQSSAENFPTTQSTQLRPSRRSTKEKAALFRGRLKMSRDTANDIQQVAFKGLC